MTPFLILIAECIIIQLLLVWIIDLTDLIDHIESALAKWLKTKKVKIGPPWSCSLCAVWWTTLLFVIISPLPFNIFTIGLCGLLAFLTPVSLQLLLLIRGIGEKTLIWIQEKLGL